MKDMRYRDKPDNNARRREWARQYYQAHRDARRAYAREWAHRNPDKLAEYEERRKEKERQGLP